MWTLNGLMYMSKHLQTLLLCHKKGLLMDLLQIFTLDWLMSFDRLDLCCVWIFSGLPSFCILFSEWLGKRYFEILKEHFCLYFERFGWHGPLERLQIVSQSLWFYVWTFHLWCVFAVRARWVFLLVISSFWVSCWFHLLLREPVSLYALLLSFPWSTFHEYSEK